MFPTIQKIRDNYNEICQYIGTGFSKQMKDVEGKLKKMYEEYKKAVKDREKLKKDKA
jgi:uncharacterized protein YozE (UPF0346 family)